MMQKATLEVSGGNYWSRNWVIQVLGYMRPLSGCHLLEFLGRNWQQEKIRSSGGPYKAGAVIKNLTFDSIVSGRTGGLVKVWNPARQALVQTSL